MLNLYDAPAQEIEFGGILSTFTYLFESNARPSPWTYNSGNLMIQGYFDNPWYLNMGGNPGGNVAISVIVKNKYSSDLLRYVISIYRFGSANNFYERPVLIRDTFQNADFASTLVKNGTKWVTKSPYSKSTEGPRNYTVSDFGGWPDFYRVNITNADLKEILLSTGSSLTPQNWEVTAISLIFELEDTGFGSLAGSFRAFEVYKSDQPL